VSQAGPDRDQSETIPADRLLPWAIAVASATPRRLADIVTMTPDDVLRRRPEAGEWSALEVVHHLVDCERLVFPVRIRAMLGGASEIPAVDEHAMTWHLDRPAGEVVETFAGLRAATVALLATITGPDLERRAVHEDYGPVTIGHKVHYLAAHDLAHLQQIERAVMQPLIPGAGPWAANIADLVMR
jgi:hypothetical protein